MTGMNASGVQNLTGDVSRSVFIRVAVLCAAVAFLDGFVTTSVAVAAPLIRQRFHLMPWQLGWVFSSALFGAAIGAISFGRLSDRFGRRRMLLASTLIFGIFSLASAAAGTFGTLIGMRFLVGLGLGGAAPCFIATIAEFAPRTLRAKMTSLVWAAFPLGALIGTFFCAYLVSVSGWQSIFVAGGVAPLLVTVALAIWLPESTRFLALKNGTLSLGARNVATAGMRNILMNPGTILLWFVFLVGFGSVVAVFSFAPTIMHDHGIPVPRAALVVGVCSIGPLVGSAVTGWLLDRFGPRIVLTTVLVAGAVGTACVGYASQSLGWTTLVLASIGFLVGGVGYTGLVAFAAVLYPTPMRSTGVGCALGAGRFGQAIMPLGIGFMLAAGLSYGQAFLLLGLILAAGAFGFGLLQRRRRQSLQPELRPLQSHR